IASPMPVLPEVASITVWPGLSSPDFSAASITPSARRSFTEPSGLNASILTNRFTCAGASLLMRTTGVLPTVPRMLSNLAMCSSALLTASSPCRHRRALLKFQHKDRETSMHRRRFIALGAAAIAAPTLVRAASAQVYPSRFVRLIVPFPPGGAVDAAARIIANRLSEMWGQQMVIENKGGAGGNIAALAVLNSEPDGYTVYICSIGHAINQFLYPSIGYNPVTDFAPVTLMCVYPNIMAVPNSSPDRSVPDFIARAKADPGKVT